MGEEVKHGKWKVAPYIKRYKHTNIPLCACSVCGEDFCDVLTHYSLYRYCPWCGARMDEKEIIYETVLQKIKAERL